MTAPYDPAAPPLVSFHDRVGDFRAGRDSPRDLLERCLATIDAREPVVQAFVATNRDGARAAADAATRRYRDGRPASPIDGLPTGLKDVIETADMPTRYGSPLFAGNATGRDAPVVEALRGGGAAIVGKLATTEFAYGDVAATTNPFDATRTPGTSSSGPAAAVGAGMLPAALGSQLMSSVMRPAAYCGHVGVKPTWGTVRQDAVHPFSPSGEHLGVHAATLADAWLVLRWLSREAGPIPGQRALAGPAAPPPPARPARLARMYTGGWDIADDAVRAAFAGALATLADAGVEIVEPAADPLLGAVEDDFCRTLDIIAEVAAFEMRWPFFAYAERRGPFGARIDGLLARAREITVDDYHAALDWKAAARGRLAAAAARVDGFVGLTAPEVAPAGLANIGHTHCCAPCSCLGAPAVSLPVLAAHGLPLGLQLMGFAGADATLFAHAAWVADTVLAG